MKKLIPLITLTSALLVLVIYLNFAVSGIEFSLIPSLIMAISIGIVAIAGAVEIHKELSVKHQGTTLTLGTLFLVIGFSFFVLMILVQQAVFITITESDAADPSEKLIAQGLNYVQLGMDVTFDVFYSLGLVLVSWVMMKEPGYTRLIGAYGVICGIFLAGFNLATFPLPPSQAGLLDVGPATILWWLSIIVLGFFESGKQPSSVSSQ